MAVKKLKVGCIGCGKIARVLHLNEYSLNPEADIIALCDTDNERLTFCADRFGVKKTYSDYKKMLAEEKLDAVSVCLPNYLHHPVTMAALKTGVNVLVEKPMALSSDQAAEMIATARENKKLLMVSQTQRFSPVHRKAKEVMDSGIMGRILHVATSFGHPGPEGWSPWGKWFFDKAEAGYGPMADLGIHKADLVRYLTGKEVAEVNGFYTRSEKEIGDVEDNFVSSLRFTDGTVGTLSTSWTVKGMGINYTYLYCANGTLAVSAIPGRPLAAFMVKPKCTIEFEVPPIQHNEEGAWNIGITVNFLNAIQGKEECLVPGEEGKAALDIILACDEAARTGKTVTLKH